MESKTVEAAKSYPTDAEIAKVMEERKLNRISAVHFLRRQAVQPTAKPVVDRKATREAHAGKKPRAVKKAKSAGDGKTTYHKPTAKMQEQIDDAIRAAVKKAFGKVVPITGCLGQRNSNSKKGGAPYQRYFLANGHTVFVSGWHQESGPRVTVSDQMADRKSYTVKRHLEAFARKQARADAKLAAEKVKTAKSSVAGKNLAQIA